MKRTLNGLSAYGKIISAEIPAKTKSYTPISHGVIVNKIRNEITTAGYSIKEELYRCSNNGEIAVGTFKLHYKEDPDIDMALNFLNSYNKQYAFKFNLGGLVKICSNGLMINNNKFKQFKRVHKGLADVMSENVISDSLKDSEIYWNSLVKAKDKMKEVLLTTTVQHDIIGELFFRKKLLSTLQMNIIHDEIAKPSFDYKTDPDSAWVLYNHITHSLKESHPATWMQDQLEVHDLFEKMLDLDDEDLEDIEELSEDEIFKISEDEITDYEPEEIEDTVKIDTTEFEIFPSLES